MEEMIIRSLQGAATEIEERELLAWRSASAANEEQYQEVRAVWVGMQRPELATWPPPAERLMAAAQARRAAPFTAPARPRWTRAPVLAAAAAIALLVVGVGWPWLGRLLERQQSAAIMERVTGPGETAMLHLSDGTVVQLAPETEFRVMGDPRSGAVWLDGRAFFGVPRRRPDHPFVVRTPAGEAVVLGTRFELVAQAEDLRVMVVDGRVALSVSDGELEVGAGEISVRSREGHSTVDRVEDVERKLEWMGRSLVFQETPLDQVAREVESRYGISVDLADPALARQTITGGFEDQRVEDVIDAICRVLSARCSVTEAGAIIG